MLLESLLPAPRYEQVPIFSDVTSGVAIERTNETLKDARMVRCEEEGSSRSIAKKIPKLLLISRIQVGVGPSQSG